MSPNLLMPNQEKIEYGKREHGIGWSRNREMGRGDEGTDEGTSRQLACPRLSVRTQMCGADVNTHVVQALPFLPSVHSLTFPLSPAVSLPSCVG